MNGPNECKVQGGRPLRRNVACCCVRVSPLLRRDPNTAAQRIKDEVVAAEDGVLLAPKADDASFDGLSTSFAETLRLALVLSLTVKTFSQQVVASSIFRGDTPAPTSVALRLVLFAAADSNRKQSTVQFGGREE